MRSEKNELAFLLATLSDVSQNVATTSISSSNANKTDSVPLLKPPKKRTGDDEGKVTQNWILISQDDKTSL